MPAASSGAPAVRADTNNRSAAGAGSTTAVRLRDLQREQAQLRQLRPDFPAPSFARVEDLPARLEAVLLAQESLNHLAELLLLGSGSEEHGKLLQPEDRLGDDVLLD